MTSSSALAASPRTDLAHNVATALRGAARRAVPFEHWLLADVLTPEFSAAMLSLPLEPATTAENLGRRETLNALRRFFCVDTRRRFPVCDRVADAFQSAAAMAAVEDVSGARLAGSYLRIEFCQDRNGFWLEP